jgi:hypothetical protein
MRLLSRVSEVRKGLFRPEVAWANGKRSDIVFGELYDNRMRALVTAQEAAAIAMASATVGKDRWDERIREAQRSFEDARRMIDCLQASF